MKKKKKIEEENKMIVIDANAFSNANFCKWLAEKLAIEKDCPLINCNISDFLFLPENKLFTPEEFMKMKKKKIKNGK